MSNSLPPSSMLASVEIHQRTVINKYNRRMDWINRLKKISNKFKFQLFGRKVLDLEQCYLQSAKFDPQSTGFMNEGVFNLFLNSCGVFLTTQELRSIGDHYRLENRDINYVEFIQFIRKDISEKRLATIQHAFEQLSEGGQVSLSTVINAFRPDKHPHHRTRTKEGELLFKEFEEAIVRRSSNGTSLTEQEFFEYFFDVNACIPQEREEYFIDLVIHTFGIDEHLVTNQRIREVQLNMYEKIRDKTYVKFDEGNASKRAFRYFDLEDRGVIDYKRFKDGLDKLGCTFNEAEMKAVYLKQTFGAELMTYEMFSAMFFEMGSGKIENPNPVYELAKNTGGNITSNGMSKIIR